MLDKITAQQLAKDFKIDIFTIYREYLQILFLKYFYQQKDSAKNYFKGGTALRLLYHSFRFSEDLDFTSLSSIAEIKVLLANTVVEINREIPDITLKDSKSVRGFSGKISQQLPGYNFPLTIKLDFSIREQPVFPKTMFLETVFPVSPYPLVAHLAIAEIMAEKIRALLSRTRGRDLFDLWFLLSKNVVIDWAVVNNKISIYNKTADLITLQQVIENFPTTELTQDLNKFLPLSHRGLIKDIKNLVLQKIKTL